MTSILADQSLLPYNTFGLPARAARFTTVTSIAELQSLLRQERPTLILGGGSNILFTRDVAGLVLKNDIKGINTLEADEQSVTLQVGGGEVWHDFVRWTVAQGYGGIENMSLIPGSVGAAPIQNIGAYGVELKDVMLRLDAVDLDSGLVQTFQNAACRFGYRDSVFKHEAKGRYCIVNVVFKLQKPGFHKINTAYGDIQKKLAENGAGEPPTIADISRAVIEIRQSKLPDPAKIGNCGSFFKNPETERSVIDKILLQYPQAPHYPLPDGRVKIPAGWLIEQCGWKGKRVGNTGSYEKQALVLVNYGNARGEEVWQLATAIIASVEERFGVRLEAEVNVY